MWSIVRLHRLPSWSWVRLHSGSAMPSTLSTVEVEAKAPLITAYSSGGFTLQNAFVVGSVGLLPRGYFHWNIKRAEDITIESLALFHMVVPRIDLLVIGSGSGIVQLDRTIREFLSSKGIRIEMQDTPNACATFNYLLEDMRLAAAALIPPETID